MYTDLSVVAGSFTQPSAERAGGAVSPGFGEGVGTEGVSAVEVEGAGWGEAWGLDSVNRAARAIALTAPTATQPPTRAQTRTRELITRLGSSCWGHGGTATMCFDDSSVTPHLK